MQKYKHPESDNTIEVDNDAAADALTSKGWVLAEAKEPKAKKVKEGKIKEVKKEAK